MGPKGGLPKANRAGSPDGTAQPFSLPPGGALWGGEEAPRPAVMGVMTRPCVMDIPRKAEIGYNCFSGSKKKSDERALDELFDVEAEPAHVRNDARPAILEKVLALVIAQPLARTGRDEHADAALDHDQPLFLEGLVSLCDSERIRAEIGGEATDRRQRIGPSPCLRGSWPQCDHAGGGRRGGLRSSRYAVLTQYRGQVHKFAGHGTAPGQPDSAETHPGAHPLQ